MNPPSVFSWFDRAILGAIFAGIVLVGLGMIFSLQAASDAVIIAKQTSGKADRNFVATTDSAESRRVSDQVRGNQTIGIFLPMLLDVDEDIEQIKRHLNISSGGDDDLWYIRFNGSHLNINNQTFISIPNFRQLLGVTNSSDNADVLTIKNETAN
jgi:hypothetical protein